jgi:hypothetical protein
VVTLTWPGDLVSDQVQWHEWHPVVSSCAPGVAVAVTMADRLRLVVLDLADLDLAERDAPDDRGAEVLREVSRSTSLSAADIADQLAVDDGGGSRCSSVAIADLFSDGALDLQLRNAPPAVLLAPGTTARILSGNGTGTSSSTGETRHRLASGEVLLLCSASFLEDPPPVLGTVRGSPADDVALATLRRALTTALHRGASASVAADLLDL